MHKSQRMVEPAQTDGAGGSGESNGQRVPPGGVATPQTEFSPSVDSGSCLDAGHAVLVWLVEHRVWR